MSIKNLIDETIPISSSSASQFHTCSLGTKQTPEPEVTEEGGGVPAAPIENPLDVAVATYDDLMLVAFDGGLLWCEGGEVRTKQAMPWRPKTEMIINDVFFKGYSRHGSIKIESNGVVSMRPGPNFSGSFSDTHVQSPKQSFYTTKNKWFGII